MDLEILTEQLYEKALALSQFLKKVDHRELLAMMELITVEIIRTWISWIVLMGSVAFRFFEILFLQSIYSWFSPFKSTL